MPAGAAAAEPPASSLPRWVRWADALTLVLAGMALWVFVTGGSRIRLGDLRLSMTSPWRLFLLASALLVVRHAVFRTPPLHRRHLALLRSLWHAPSIHAALPPFVVSRAVVLTVGYLAVATIGFQQPPPWRISYNEVLNLPARWDSGWYLDILRQGYASTLDPDRPSSIAFFPAFPLVTRAVAVVTRTSDPLAAFLVVVVAFFWALTYLYRLARMDLSADAAQAALMFAVFYPYAVYFSALYTESLFLLVAVGAFYHFRRGDLVRAGLFGLVAGLTRPNGCMLALPLGLLALIELARSRGWLSRPSGGAAPLPIAWLAGRLLAASMPVAGVVAYSAYVYHLTGDPLAWATAQRAWGRGVDSLMQLVGARQAMVATQGVYAYTRVYAVEVTNALAALFALVAIWPVSRRFGLPYGLFVALCILPDLLGQQ